MNRKVPQIEFVLHDRVDGVEITPTTIGLSRFNEFNQQVATFIAGSEGLKLDDVQVSVGEGSYKLTVLLTAMLVAALEPDLQALQRPDSLGEIDPKRAEVIAKWQARTKGNANLRFEVRPFGFKAKPIKLSNATDYRIGDIVPWVKVEKYLFGTVMDMGGAQKANVHIRLEDTGQIVRIGTNQGYLKDQTENRLYRKVLVRVEADQHFRTKALRNLRLLSFEDYEPHYDEAALDRFAERGRQAWAGVSDAAEWVRQLRGGQ
jgi:hypothetical protein